MNRSDYLSPWEHMPRTCLLCLILLALPRTSLAALDIDGFNPIIDGTVQAVVTQTDGKVLIGGDFKSVDGVTRSNIARLNADGRLDTGFSSSVGANRTVRALSPQADGKVLIGGDFTSVNGTARNYIARLNVDGSLDAGFDPGSGANSVVYAVATQADGKVLFGGGFTSVDGTTRHGLARLNADGSLDTAFDSGIGVNDFVYAVFPQTDGKILIGGEFNSINGTAIGGIARLNIDGSLDTGFSSSNAGANGTVTTLSPQADGKVLIGGGFTSVNGTARNHIARLNADGTLDTGFNPKNGANEWVYSLFLQADGKVLIGGDFTSVDGMSRNYIARLNVDGSLDIGVGSSVGTNDTVRAVVQQADGKLLIGGDFTSAFGQVRNGIAQLNLDGNLDRGFGGSGANSSVNALASQPDGKLLIGGFFTNVNGQMKSRVARLTADGRALDRDFTGSAINGAVWALSLQADGKLLIGGNFTRINGVAIARIARLNVDGSLDTSFNSEVNDAVRTLSPRADGKVLIGGDFTTVNGVFRSRIARLNSDGSLDNSFNSEVDNSLRALSVQADGKVLIGGNFTSVNSVSRNRIARLNTDGSIDNSFNLTSGADDWVYTLFPQADGKVLIGGDFTNLNGASINRIARLNTNGSTDTSFASFGGADDTVFTLSQQADGKVLIGGSFTSVNGSTRNRIARLGADGALDAGFDVGTGANNAVVALSQQADGKVLIGGAFTVINGSPRNRIARLVTDEAALQNVKLDPEGDMIKWDRGGSSPILERVTFESSVKLGGPWTLLGEGQRSAGGWQLDRPNLPAASLAYIRARGYYSGGAYNGSSSITESIRQVYLHQIVDDSLCFPINAANGKVAVICL